MTREEFEALVQRLEAEWQRHPKRFVANTVLLVAGAYGYLLLALLLSLGIVGVVIAIVVFKPNAATVKLAIFLSILFGGMAWAIVKGLWVRIAPPEGLRITAEEAPALFDMLGELQRSLDCAPFHEVLIVTEHNAAVVQVPRLGIFGWHKNYLLLGLPLLQGLAPEEFKAVLAHEFAHSSRGHGRFGNWLYRLRRSWERVVEEVYRQENRGSKILTWFLQFFWPRFNGRAFVLSRANEYEADNCALRLTSARDAANALMRVELNARYLDERFWPNLFELATANATPPGDVFAQSARRIRQSAQAEEAGKWLRQSFLAETGTVDTHPALKDRVRALGAEPAPELAPIEKSAGEVFLGDKLEAIAERLSLEWNAQVAPVWKTRHEEAARVARELETLEAGGAEPGAKATEVLWKKAQALIDLKGDAAAAELLERILAEDPKHPGALFVQGRYLLGKDESAGLELMERAMVEDPFVTEAACQILYQYWMRAGRREKVREIENRVDAFHELQQKAQAERNVLTVVDTFLPHELDLEQVASVRSAFASEPEVGAVAVARKQCDVFPQAPAFAVAIEIDATWWKPRGEQANQKIVNRVCEKLQLPGYFLVFVAEKEMKRVAEKIFKMEGAIVYEKPS